ncbi:MAG TPA: alkaline phosphatase family protein [Ilumatobacter sp.]|nr:alkaline phosphatase family protein [Ilumatobacter sp.]
MSSAANEQTGTLDHEDSIHGREYSIHGRVVLIGLDAADSQLLTAAIDAGHLPSLAKMRDRGAWGNVPPLAGFGSGAVWPSFSTGVSPAKHGRYFYRQVGPGSYEAQDFHPDRFRADPVWVQASRAGRKVAVFDVPKVGLSDEINGVMAVDWISHGPVYPEMRTFPESFADELTGTFGRNSMRRCDMPGGRSIKEFRQFAEAMNDRVEQRERCTRHYLEHGDFDLLVTVFADPHCVGHQTWHIRDPKHPLHDPAALEQLGDPLLDVYRSIDGAIGRIVDDIDDDTTVIVFSGTGMGPNYTGNHLLDDVLRRIEGRNATTVARTVRYVKRRLKKILPRDVRRKSQKLKRRIEEQSLATDRAGRRAFAVPHNDIAGAIRLNVVGREQHGLLERAEVDAYVGQLTKELQQLRNVDTGNAVVESVVRVSEHHSGDAIDDLPDLFVIWNRSAPIDRVQSSTVGTVEYVHRGNRTGDHEAESIFFAVGPQVEPGRVDDMQIYDFAPTIAALLGTEVDVTDGRVVEALAGRASSRSRK